MKRIIFLALGILFLTAINAQTRIVLKADGSGITPGDTATLNVHTNNYNDIRFTKQASNLSDVADPSTALNNLLPTQSTSSGKVLQTNGTSASWQTPGGSTVQPYTWIILQSGQSNAWGASGPTGFDTASNSKIKIWQHAQASPAWVTARINQRPFRTSGYNAVDGGATREDLNSSGNSAFYLAKKIIALHPTDSVKIILAIGDGQAISLWFNGATKGRYTDSITTRLTASGVDHVDLFVWIQGESDQATSEATYLTSFDSLKATLRRHSAFAPTTPIVVTGLVPGGGFNGKDTTFQKMDYSNDVWVGYANSENATAGTESLHFSGGSLDTLGQIKILQAWQALPLRNSERLRNIAAINSRLIIAAKNDLTAQTATNASVATYTTGAADSTFHIDGRLTVTAVTGGTVKLSVTYTDETNTSRTIDFFSMGTTTAALSATGVSSFPVLSIRAKASTAITVSTTVTSTITYNVGATITKIR